MPQEDNKQKGYQVVNTKINLMTYYQLKKLLRKKGLNMYQMIQNFCDCLVRNMDDRHNLTPENEQLMSTFEHMIGWEDNFNLADPTAKPEISEATYYMNDTEGKKGVRVVHVEKPFFGQWTQDFNVHHIMEKFLCKVYPPLYRQLRFIAACRGFESVLQLLYDVAAELEDEELKKERLKDFEDADRGDFGQKPDHNKYRRHLNRTPDMFDNNEP